MLPVFVIISALGLTHLSRYKVSLCINVSFPSGSRHSASLCVCVSLSLLLFCVFPLVKFQFQSFTHFVEF